MEFDSAFKGSHTSDAAEVVWVVECMLCLTKEDSVSTGLEISCEEPCDCESSLSDGSTDMVITLLMVGCSTCGFLMSRSFVDSVTASMNICIIWINT